MSNLFDEKTSDFIIPEIKKITTYWSRKNDIYLLYHFPRNNALEMHEKSNFVCKSRYNDLVNMASKYEITPFEFVTFIIKYQADSPEIRKEPRPPLVCRDYCSFDLEEDEMIFKLFEVEKLDWGKIGEIMKRNSRSCRTRYEKIKKEEDDIKWTPEQDELIIINRASGYNWIDIAKILKRKPIQVKNRFFELKEYVLKQVFCSKTNDDLTTKLPDTTQSENIFFP